jgi:hypothetical protein
LNLFIYLKLSKFRLANKKDADKNNLINPEIPLYEKGIANS